MTFSEDVIDKAWQRQEGRCAACDRLMVRQNRNKRGTRGAWQAHHRKPLKDGGTNYLSNCVLLHIKCHLSDGHDGDYKRRVSGGEKRLKSVNLSSYSELDKAVRGLHWEL